MGAYGRVWIRKKGNNDDISRCREPMGGYGSGRKELIIIYLDAGSLWEGMDQEERIWNQMSDEEKMLRLKDLQRRIFSDIGNKGNNQDSIETYSGRRLYQYYEDAFSI